jgi:hypothetical protein
MVIKVNNRHSDTNLSAGMVEKSETLQLKTSRISKTRKDSYARDTIKCVKAFFSQPGVEEDFQAWLIEYQKRKKTTSQ